MHQDSNGVSRLVLYSEASGAGSASYGNGAVVNKPPFVTRTVSRGLTVKASSYGNVAISTNGMWWGYRTNGTNDITWTKA